MANKDKAADEIQMISSSELKPYEDAPFKVRDDENMKELVQSIKDSGILVPLIARPHAEGGYEILAGHRRAEASRQNNFEKVPVIVGGDFLFGIQSNAKERLLLTLRLSLRAGSR
mgnify:CR=1 FL=1